MIDRITCSNHIWNLMRLLLEFFFVSSQPFDIFLISCDCVNLVLFTRYMIARD